MDSCCLVVFIIIVYYLIISTDVIVDIGLPLDRISIPTLQPDLDRMPNRVLVPRIEIDPPIPTLKTDPIR